MNSVFGPLNAKKHCLVFKVLAIMTFLIALLVTIAIIVKIGNNLASKKGIFDGVQFGAVTYSVAFFIEYYILRILLGICEKSL